MKAVDIEFTGKARKRRAWAFRLSVACLLAVASGYGATALHQYCQWHQLTVELNAAQHELQQAKAARDRPLPEPAYAADAAAIARLAEYRWDHLLTALEVVQVPGVSVKKLQVDADKAQADVELEYAGVEQLTAHFGQLVGSQPAWRLLKAAGGTAQLQLAQADIPPPPAPSASAPATSASTPVAGAPGTAPVLTMPPPIPAPPVASPPSAVPRR